jgi:hypothetical protein
MDQVSNPDPLDWKPVPVTVGVGTITWNSFYYATLINHSWFVTISKVIINHRLSYITRIKVVKRDEVGLKIDTYSGSFSPPQVQNKSVRLIYFIFM